MIPAKSRKIFILFIVFSVPFFLSVESVSQDTLSKEKYEKAASFMWDNINNKTAFNLRVQPNWFSDSSGVWYVLHSKSGKKFEKISFPTMDKSPLFNHKKLAAVLSELSGDEVEVINLPLDNVVYMHGDSVRLRFKDVEYQFDLKRYRYEIIEEKMPNQLESTSPDGKWTAFTIDYNLFLKSTETGDTFQLSKNGFKNYEYASYFGWYDIVEGENGERPERFSVNWSHDSKFIQTNICDLRSAEKMYLLDWSVDTLYRPKLLGYYRGSPGDTTMIHMIPVFFDVEKKEELSFDLPRNTHINNVSFKWSTDTGIVYSLFHERGYQGLHLAQLDLIKRTKEDVYEETSKTNIDNFRYWLAENADVLVFASEQSGWRQLYTLNLKSKLIEPITKGDYYVDDVEFIDEENGLIYFLASGKEDGQNPYLRNFYRVKIDGTQLRLLTPENANHEVNVSPGGEYFFDNISSAHQPTRTVMRSMNDGKIVAEIAEADVSALVEKDWKFPKTFETVARDGKAKIYGAAWIPTDFDPTKKYPVIDHSYTGPHTQMFPRDFRRVLSLSNQALAELGFVVVMIDGLGSSGRSKEFHNHSYKNLGGSLEDHIIWIKAFAQKYSWADASKVGIFGHSAGGYDAAHALLEYPEFYSVAVSSSADHDHRMEKAWWPEMYMGWPVDSAYHLQSNITMAPNLKGKLLITHGGIDDNVNPSATFKLADALIKADKQFDMLILPSQRHGYKGEYLDYFRKVRWNYFVQNLKGKTPQWDFQWK